MKMEPTWQSDCGRVQLYLGDCRDILPSIQCDALVTDPPYGMKYVSGWRANAHDPIHGDDVELLKLACSHVPSHSSYVFCRWDTLPNMPLPKSLIHWVKNNHTSGDLEHSHGRSTEQIAFYPGSQHRWPNGRPRDVVFADKASTDAHPTEKPVSLMVEVVGWTDGVVCDPFMGSGTTGVACVQLNRRFIGIEKEPKYFEIAKRRIMEAMGKEVTVNGVRQRRMFA